MTDTAKLQSVNQKQRNHIAQMTQKIERQAEDCHRLRRILRNAMDDATGWREDAKGEIMRREW